MERPITIRFSHIDAAALVFYPRYFELLSELFGELPFAGDAFAMQTDFLKPNYLGDRVLIESATTADGWSFTGRMQGDDHFSIRSLPAEQTGLDANAHRPAEPAFRSTPMVMADWTTDRSGRLQVSRFFELANKGVEEWFADSLGMSFRELHTVRGDGIPTVRMRTHCRELPHAGETATMWIRPTKIGSRSLTYTAWLVRDDTCLLQNEQTIVWVELNGDKSRSKAIPDSVRQRLQDQYVAA